MKAGFREGLIAVILLMAAGCQGTGLVPGTTMPLGLPTAPPQGYLDYCSGQGAADTGCRIVLSTERLEELRAVQRSVNAEIRWVADAGEDAWTVLEAGGTGDCDDFAVTKLNRLVEAGWPRQALRLALAALADGTPHLVLTVDTTAGTLVLDNRQAGILPWDEFRSYSWIAQEVPGRPYWVAVAG